MRLYFVVCAEFAVHPDMMMDIICNRRTSGGHPDIMIDPGGDV